MAGGNWQETTIVLNLVEKVGGDLLMNFMYLKKSLIPVNLGYAILTPTRNIDFKFMCRTSKLNVIQLSMP